MEQPPEQRPPSIRSVASISTISSTTSLSRRPRTRTRSRTVTGATTRPSDPPLDALPLDSDLPYLTGPIVQEPVDIGQVPPLPSAALAVSEPPPRPPKSPQRQEALEPEVASNDTASSQGGTAADATVVAELPPPVASSSARPVKTTKALNLTPLDTGYRPPPSAFSRDPALTPVVNVRDSVSTQRSGASSSIYPPSTPTMSRPESPTTPLSMAQQFEPAQTAPMSPEIQEAREYDSDDVAYRLRLLVKNNYFLPPAHSKPSPADFAAASLDLTKKSTKSPNPTFLDIFRVGKSKSKPTTPTGASGPDYPAPMLRTASDSITASYAVRTQPRTSGQMARVPVNLPHNHPPAAPRGRVVVVREKMEDILTAAKQAEQDLKTKGAARGDQGSQKDKPDTDIIDPTDAVDIPLPSPTYPFAVQASALHGLGVQDSVGAALLADRLPPNMSNSADPAEDSWRKALLQQAVHLSLDNTPDLSSFSQILGASTPLGSPRSKSMDTPRIGTPATTQQLLEQKIIAQPIIDLIESSPTKQKRPKSSHSQGARPEPKARTTMLTVNTSNSSRPGSYLPHRVDTPSGPMTSLEPAPRRAFAGPISSISQTDLTAHEHSFSSSSMSDVDSHRSLRRFHSSPQLAEDYESSAMRQDILLPPMPAFSRDSRTTFVSSTRGSFETAVGQVEPGTRTPSLHSRSFTDEAPPRPSMATSRSEYSQASASPTTSAFQDFLNRDDVASSDVHAGPSRFSIDQQNAMRGSPSLRYSAMSPPPRMSSSLAHVALPPPPRTSSLAYQALMRNYIVPPLPSASSSDSSRTQPADNSILEEEPTLQIVAPEPTTPPLPEDAVRREERRSHESRAPSSRVPPSLHLSNSSVPASIHSAPGPSAPTSFFDSIQSQPNAMDDLESSSDESEDDEEQVITTTTPKLFGDPRARAASAASPDSPSRSVIMKHGNFSTPYIRPGASASQSALPSGLVSAIPAGSKMPIVNIPQPVRMTKKDLVSPSYDFFRYAQEHPPAGSAIGDVGELRRPMTADHVLQSNAAPRTTQESLKKLDGMLMKHMENEKDTIKRIATTLKQTSQT